MLNWQGSISIEEQRENDKKKREYCLKNNIPLIEILYKDYEKIDADYLLNLIYQKGE